MPGDWAPTPKHEAKARELGLDVTAEAEAFRDFHEAKGSTMLVWDKAFFTWLRNATRFGAAPSAPAQPDYIDTPEDAGTAMTLAEAVQYCPAEYRKPIQEYLGGI